MFAFHRCLNANHGVAVIVEDKERFCATILSDLTLCMPGISNSLISFLFFFLCSRRIMNFVAVCFNWFWLNFSSFLWPNLTSVYTVAAPLEVAMVAISVSFPHSATIKVKSLFSLLLCLSRICCYISVSSALSESGNVIRFFAFMLRFRCENCDCVNGNFSGFSRQKCQ